MGYISYCLALVDITIAFQQSILIKYHLVSIYIILPTRNYTKLTSVNNLKMSQCTHILVNTIHKMLTIFQ